MPFDVSLRGGPIDGFSLQIATADAHEICMPFDDGMLAIIALPKSEGRSDAWLKYPHPTIENAKGIAVYTKGEEIPDDFDENEIGEEGEIWMPKIIYNFLKTFTPKEFHSRVQ